MKVVGLYLAPNRVSAAVVLQGLRQAELVDSFTQAYGKDDELLSILRERARGWAGCRIVVGIPGREFTQRTVTLPFSDRKRIEKALVFELEDLVPFGMVEVATDHFVLEGDGGAKKKEHRVAGVMIAKTSLRQHLDRLAAAGIDPQAIVPSFVGIAAVATKVAVEGVALVISGSDLCLRDGKAIRACRSFALRGATGGLAHTVKALETEESVRITKAVLVGENSEALPELTRLGIAVEQIAAEHNGKRPADPVSLGLALDGQMNFRKNEFAYRLADAGRRRKRRSLIIAGSIAAALLAANLGVKYYLVESSYGRLDREIKEVFRQAAPDAKIAGDPVRLLRSRIDDAKKRFGVLGTGTSALDVMKAVTDGIPKEIRVSFQDFVLEGDRLRLAGEAASFEAVDKMKAELMKAEPFSDVQVQDTRMGVDNKVKFRFEIKLKQSM